MKRCLAFILSLTMLFVSIPIYASVDTQEAAMIQQTSDCVLSLCDTDGIYKVTYHTNMTDTAITRAGKSSFECKFYELEGYGITKDMLVGDVSDSSENIAFCSVNTTTGEVTVVEKDNDNFLKYSLETPTVTGNISLYNDVNDAVARGFQISNDGMIYQTISLDTDYELYCRLMNSVFWDFEKENPDYKCYEEDFFLSEVDSDSAIAGFASATATGHTSPTHDFVVSGSDEAIEGFDATVNKRFHSRYLQEVGCYTGHSHDSNSNVNGYYNVQTFRHDGALVSLIAVWDISVTVSNVIGASNYKDVSSSMTKSYNLCTMNYNSSNNTIEVSEPGDNYTYIVTNNALYAIALIGSRNYAYLYEAYFKRTEGGSSKEPFVISDAVAKALCCWLLPDEVISAFSAISDICTAAGSIMYSDESYKITNAGTHCRAIKASYPEVTYKRYSRLFVRGLVANIPTLGTARIQYEMDIVGCKEDSSTHRMTARITKSIAS